MASDVTLDEVARRSGVSRATASRALNGKAGVSTDVRDRVRIVADGLGYRPNRAAKNLAGGRTSVIGLVLGTDELISNVYAQALIQAIAHAADRHDEGLMLLLDSKEPNVVVRNLLDDGLVDGVIVSALAVGERWVEELLSNQMPAVLVGAHPRRDDVQVVDTEGTESTAALVDHVMDRGANRVVYVAGHEFRVDARTRLDGYRLAHERRGLPVDESLIVPGDFTRRLGFALADQILALQPDAVIGANDETCVGFLDRARELGVEAPRDLLVAGFDGISESRPRFDLTTLEQPFDALADCAVRSLVALVRGDAVEREQLIAPTLRIGATTTRSSPGPDREAAMPS